MRRSATRDFIVGLFVLGGLIGVGWLSIGVGDLDVGTDDPLVVYAAFDEIGGLKQRAPIRLSGVKVGQVGAIELNDDYRAWVRLELDRRLEYPIDTSASIVTAGLLGDQYISLLPGGDVLMLEDGDELSFTDDAILLERLIGKFIHDTPEGD